MRLLKPLRLCATPQRYRLGAGGGASRMISGGVNARPPRGNAALGILRTDALFWRALLKQPV